MDRRSFFLKPGDSKHKPKPIQKPEAKPIATPEQGYKGREFKTSFGIIRVVDNPRHLEAAGYKTADVFVSGVSYFNTYDAFKRTGELKQAAEKLDDPEIPDQRRTFEVINAANPNAKVYMLQGLLTAPESMLQEGGKVALSALPWALLGGLDGIRKGIKEKMPRREFLSRVGSEIASAAVISMATTLASKSAVPGINNETVRAAHDASDALQNKGIEYFRPLHRANDLFLAQQLYGVSIQQSKKSPTTTVFFRNDFLNNGVAQVLQMTPQARLAELEKLADEYPEIAERLRHTQGSLFVMQRIVEEKGDKKVKKIRLFPIEDKNFSSLVKPNEEGDVP